ncbi:MAG: TonB-dependent receptor [Planctomycetes bacterium]|nr:TonB-dependent receptor [Planctomycetota bacterium]
MNAPALVLLAPLAICSVASTAVAQEVGAIRGVIFDADFNAPLSGAQVLIVETGAKSLSDEQGAYSVQELRPGKYTLVISKDGYVRQVRTDVVVIGGQLTDLDVQLAGEFTDMEEFVVEDLLKMDTGSEVALLDLKLESPALLDSVGAELMSRAGAGDAASALRLVAGATVQDGKYAVIRGLPDRYVSSQLNGVRLPTADEDKRAVELDQFPSAVIESIRVSKTFTPDQQGDASGGAVDIRLRGVPTEAVVQMSSQLGYNSQAFGKSDFLSYKGGGLNFWGRDDGDRRLQAIGAPWSGAVGVSETDAPIDNKWNLAAGGSRELSDGWKLGVFGTFFYERDSSFFKNGRQDSWWVTSPGAPMSPETNQGAPALSDFRTQLFDVDQASQSVQWGGMGLLGLESENHKLSLAFLHTRTAEDVATLATDTRAKQYFFPGYDPNDPTTPGHTELDQAPYLRLETLEYTERTASSLLLNGVHKLPTSDFAVGALRFSKPELDWTLSASEATMRQPDKRVFGGVWRPEFDEGIPGIPPTPAGWQPYKPAANFTIGNLQRIFKAIDEESRQGSLNLKLPFEQWSDNTGYVKVGAFADSVERTFDQNTFSNFGQNSGFVGDFDDSWSSAFPGLGQPITDSQEDVDYRGSIDLRAAYGMFDLPFNEQVSLVAGARFESTKIGIVNDPESFALWFPPGATAPITLVPGAADVVFEQDNVLPAIGLNYEPMERLILRAAFSQTVARQTFKELTPIIQQEYLGAPIFIGNPGLQMSDVTNYDLRVDYTPYDGGFLSASWFYKDIEDPIEYVQQFIGYNFTTAVNYPDGRLSGFELEARQDIGHFFDAAAGWSVGANATLIDSEVTLPAAEAAAFDLPNIQAPISSRDMTNAPESLLNLYLLYDLPVTGTQAGLFFTRQGDTLVAGATQSLGNFIPSIYAKSVSTLNFSLSQKLGKYFTLQFQARNLTNPDIEEVFRSEYISSDVTRRLFTRGIDMSLTLGARFSF